MHFDFLMCCFSAKFGRHACVSKLAFSNVFSRHFTGFEMQTLNSENVMNDKMSIYDCAPPSGIALHSRTTLSRIHLSEELKYMYDIFVIYWYGARIFGSNTF